FGSTETQRAISYYVIPRTVAHAGEGLAKEIIPLGVGARDVQLLLLNAQQHLVGIGEVGEILVRSPHLARGYLGDDALTQARFIANPVTGDAHDRAYRTGDLGRYLPDGNVEYLARRDQQVKLRGFRIELGEIEAVLRAHPAVREGVVVVQEPPTQDKMLVAYVVPTQDSLTTEMVADIRRSLQSKVPVYMVPAHILGLAALPLTPNGKLDRRALPLPGALSVADDMVPAPRTPLELQLMKIWESVLNLPQVGIDDNFFDLGGHSLLATQLVARVSEVLGVSLTLRQFFEAPTVAKLAYVVEHAGAATTPAAGAGAVPLTRLSRQPSTPPDAGR
ncbi:MAG: AMP-binding protein, partial [Ktedonobacterales bacterium]|nr:AMP-binding protein [Ktedonobacterales bacterium]